MTDVVMEGRNVTKTYSEGVPVAALRGVDLSVQRGTLVAIVGPSGSGKSTMLYTLGALEPPSSGQVLLEGTDFGSLTDDERTLLRRRKIGFVFQDFNLLPIYTAQENVALPLRLAGTPVAEANRRAGELLEFIGLAARRNHLPSQMSGGEQQRVAICRALVIEPAVILADEPTGNLDAANGRQVMAMLRRVVDDLEQTVILVTHDPAVAASADRVVSMRDGQIVDDYDPRESTATSQLAAPERTA